MQEPDFLRHFKTCALALFDTVERLELSIELLGLKAVRQGEGFPFLPLYGLQLPLLLPEGFELSSIMVSLDLLAQVVHATDLPEECRESSRTGFLPFKAYGADGVEVTLPLRVTCVALSLLK